MVRRKQEPVKQIVLGETECVVIHGKGEVDTRVLEDLVYDEAMDRYVAMFDDDTYGTFAGEDFHTFTSRKIVEDIEEKQYLLLQD